MIITVSLGMVDRKKTPALGAMSESSGFRRGAGYHSQDTRMWSRIMSYITCLGIVTI